MGKIRVDELAGTDSIYVLGSDEQTTLFSDHDFEDSIRVGASPISLVIEK